MKLKKTLAMLLALCMVVSIFSPAVAVDEPASETIITTGPSETTEVTTQTPPEAPAASEPAVESEAPLVEPETTVQPQESQPAETQAPVESPSEPSAAPAGSRR